MHITLVREGLDSGEAPASCWKVSLNVIVFPVRERPAGRFGSGILFVQAVKEFPPSIEYSTCTLLFVICVAIHDINELLRIPTAPIL